MRFIIWYCFFHCILCIIKHICNWIIFKFIKTIYKSITICYCIWYSINKWSSTIYSCYSCCGSKFSNTSTYLCNPRFIHWSSILQFIWRTLIFVWELIISWVTNTRTTNITIHWSWWIVIRSYLFELLFCCCTIWWI